MSTKKASVMPAVMWFRRDLRLADHPALCAAAADSADVIPLFVDDPAFDDAGGPRRAYLRAALEALDASMGGSLVIRRGDPVEQVVGLAGEVGAASVFVSRDYGPYGRRRDAAVAAALAARGARLVGVGSAYAVQPGDVSKSDGTGYAVYTPFARAWRATGWADPQPAPVVAWRGRPAVRSDPLPENGAANVPTDGMPEIGESAAWQRWQTFAAGPLGEYATLRNEPGRDATSHASADLRWGVLHPRQLLGELGGGGASGAGEEVFAKELAWREFYADVLFRHPRSGSRNLVARMDAMTVDVDEAARRRFDQWAAGRTGFPIVDAGQRQLLATGWMHNRVRMIVASFLVKDLHLPWQWGAGHFIRHLIDGDLASNSHGWQWTAGTGTDAAPYFRVFNPTAQSERFDPDGAYIRRWVGELADVQSSKIHAPGVGAGTSNGYPPPMIDHSAERIEALGRYQATR